MAYDPTVSLLPDGGGTIKPMMGGGNGGGNTATVTILGESYRIRKDIGMNAFNAEDEKLLSAFQIEGEIRESLGDELIRSFLHALANYNCDT